MIDKYNLAWRDYKTGLRMSDLLKARLLKGCRRAPTILLCPQSLSPELFDAGQI
jgi:hypothetical protein